MDDRFRQMGDRIRENVYNRVDHILNGGNRQGYGQPMYPPQYNNYMGEGQATQGGQYNGSGGNYTPWNGMPNGGHYNEGQHHTQYQQYPQPTMGFNPQQSVGHHPHEQGGIRHEIAQYMRDICSGTEPMPQELKQLIAMSAAAAIEDYMGNGRGSSALPYEGGESSNKFKKTIEKIRNTPHHQEKMRMIAERFPKVQQGTPAYKVLVDLVTKVPSIEQRAGGLQMKPEQYEELKQELKHMQE